MRKTFFVNAEGPLGGHYSITDIKLNQPYRTSDGELWLPTRSKPIADTRELTIEVYDSKGNFKRVNEAILELTSAAHPEPVTKSALRKELPKESQLFKKLQQI